MSHDAPDVIVRRYYDLFNRRALDQAEQLVSTQAIFHYPHKQRVIGRRGYRELARMWLDAFPDARIEIQRLTVEGANVVRAELIGSGTHEGTLAFTSAVMLPPSGRRAELPFSERLEVIDGRIANTWLSWNVDEMVRRLS